MCLAAPCALLCSHEPPSVCCGRELTFGPMCPFGWAGITQVSPRCHHPQGQASPHCHHLQGQGSLRCFLTATSPKDRHHSSIPSLPSSLRTGIIPVPLHCHLPQGPASLQYPLTAIIPRGGNHVGVPSLPSPLGPRTGPHKTHLFFCTKLFSQ